MPKRRRETRPRDAEKTRARILEAATAEFARKGYEGTRLRDVAEAADVHHALLHHYFGDKRGLFRAVVERGVAEIRERTTVVLATRLDTDALIERYVRTLVEFHVHSKALVRITHLSSLDETSPAFEVREEVVARVLLPLMEQVEASLARAQKAGLLRQDMSAKRMMALCSGAISHLFYEDRLYTRFLGADVRDETSRADHVDAAVRFVQAAVRPAR